MTDNADDVARGSEMTNSERAEKIAEICILAFPNKPDINLITAQLDEAVREAERMARNIYYADINNIKAKARDEGFATAREKAAGICEDLECLDEDHQACVAERIRGMTWDS